MESFANLLVLAVTTLVLWPLCSIIYSVFFHPLSQYPGPFWAKVTGWYQFFHAKNGYHHLWLYQMHQRYGSVVRVAPNRLSYNTVEAVRSIYGDRKGYVKKAGFTEALASMSNGRNLQTINDHHAYPARRRLISNAFTDEALHSSETYILDCLRNLFTIIRSKAKDDKSWTSDMDMNLWTYLLTQDILGELCFGESFGVCNQGSSDFEKLVFDGTPQVHKLGWMPLTKGVYRVIKILAEYARDHKWEIMKPARNFHDRINSMIQRRQNCEPASRKDFFHYIMQAKDTETGESLSPRGLVQEAGVLFGAGVDTSATCIAACLFYLLKYPETLAEVTSELRHVFSDVEDIVDGPKLRSLTYLRGCIDEALRLSPPVPGALLREVTGSSIIIDGKVIQPGVQVSVPIYTIHHNESYFPDAFTFKPERWSTDSKGAYKDAFMAFSLGSRSCVGRKLAYLDMTLALARLLFSFDIRLSPENERNEKEEAKDSGKPLVERGGKVEFELRDWFITQKKGPVVQFRVHKSY